MPGVCGVLESRLLEGMTATPVCFHFGAEGSSGVAGVELVDAIVAGVSMNVLSIQAVRVGGGEGEGEGEVCFSGGFFVAG
jgi:hypothetical protein